MAIEWCQVGVARVRSGALSFFPTAAHPIGKYGTELFLGAVILCSASFSGLVVPRDALHFGEAGSETTLRSSQPAGQWVQEDSVAGPLILDQLGVASQHQTVTDTAA